MDFQRSVYITINSLIQSVVFGFLFARFIGAEYINNFEYIQYLSCFFLIILTWHEYAIRAILWTWTHRLIDSMLPFLIGASQLLMMNSIGSEIELFVIFFCLYMFFSLLAFLNQYIQICYNNCPNRGLFNKIRMLLIFTMYFVSFSIVSIYSIFIYTKFYSIEIHNMYIIILILFLISVHIARTIILDHLIFNHFFERISRN